MGEKSKENLSSDSSLRELLRERRERRETASNTCLFQQLFTANAEHQNSVDEIENTSFFSYVYSSWLTKYLWKAYRKGVTLSDIPTISQMDSCSHNTQKFENLWNEEIRRRGPSSASLLLVAWRFVRVRFLIACILNILSQITKFILLIILLERLLEYSGNTERSFSSGIHWIFYIIVFDILQMILYTWSDIMNQRTALRLKAACLCFLFKKVMYVNSIGQNNHDEVMNMLSKDSHRIYDAVHFGTSIVNAPVVITCAVIYVSSCMNPLALIGLIVFLLFYLIQYWLRPLINYCNDNAKEITKTRTQKTIEILENIALIKINEWEQNFLQNVINVRKMESKWMWKLSYIKSLLCSMAHAIPIISFIVTFYIDFICKVSPTSIAYITFPICVVFIVQLHEALEAMKISLSYEKKSLETFNKLKNRLLMDDASCHIMKPYEASQALAIVNGTFVDTFKKKVSDFDNTDATKKDVDADNPHDRESEKLMTLGRTFDSKRLEILSNINFKAKKGQLIGICGASGSGKSSLLLAALGQMKMTSGQLMRQGSCAYVSQRAWIANATIQENILFDEELDSKRYYEAQVVCKLREDIKKLPNGDRTEIGDYNDTITQILRQRVALARAFYANRDIYFLDDPLSSLEEKMRQEVFEDLIIRALAEKTIILVTNAIEHLNRCDYLYIMREGKIAEHGMRKELLRLNKEYASMVKAAIADAEGDYTNEFQELQMDNLLREEEIPKKRSKVRIARNDNSNTSYNIQECNNNLIIDNDRLKKIRGVTYYTYAKSFGDLVLLIPTLLIFFIHAGIEVLNLVRLTWWIKAIDTKEIYRENKFSYYERWCGISLLLLLFGCILQSFVAQFAITRITNNMHNALLKKIIHAPMKFFNTTLFKTMKNHFLHDLNCVSLALPSKLDNVLRYIAIVFFSFFVLLSTIPWFTNYIVLSIVFFLYIGKIYRAAQINFKSLEIKTKHEIDRFLQNSIQGLSTIRTFKKENDLLSKFQELVDLSNACCFVKGVSKSWLSSRLEILTASCLFVASFFTISIQQQISPVVFGLTFVYIFQLPNIIKMSMKYLLKTEKCFINVQNICNYLYALKFDENNKVTLITPEPGWPTVRFIEFKEVYLKLSDDTPTLLNNLSFTVHNGERIGILVETEAQRKAMIAVMFGLYELNRGKITIDYFDISKIEMKLLRNLLSIVPQDPIFYGTIRTFLDPKKCHTDAEIWNALEKMHLKDKVSSTASQLNYSFDKQIFSIAENQLLYFTRAHLNQSKVLLVEDNPNIDLQTKGLFQQVIMKEFSGSTVLIFTYSARLALYCNYVLILKTGEYDVPSKLLAQENSILKSLLADQDEIEMNT